MTIPNTGLFTAPQPTPMGVMLKLYRESRGLSLRDLEKVTGLDHVTLSRIEAGRPCDATTWLRLQIWLLSPERLPSVPTTASALMEPTLGLNTSASALRQRFTGTHTPLPQRADSLPPAEPAAPASRAAHP